MNECAVPDIVTVGTFVLQLVICLKTILKC